MALQLGISPAQAEEDPNLLIQEALRETFLNGEGGEIIEETTHGKVEVDFVASFEDEMILTTDKGLVLRLTDGTEFQITIVRSRNAN